MKLKTKLASLIIGFVMVASMLFFSVWAASSANVTLSGTISFKSSNVYAEVTGAIVGAGTGNKELPKVEFKSTVEEPDVSGWANNLLTFDENGSTITITINIQNLASDRNLYASVIDQTGSITNVTKAMSKADFELKPYGSTDSEGNATDKATVTITMKVTNPDLAVASTDYGYLVELNDISEIKNEAYYNNQGFSISYTDGGLSISGYTGSETSVKIPAFIDIVPEGMGLIEPNPVVAIAAEAFKNSSVTNFTIPTTVTTIGDYAFEGTAVTNIDFIPSTVTSLGMYAFQNCKQLTSAVLPSGITSTMNTFNGCTSLANVVIPSSIETIGMSTFNGCTSLTSVEIPSSVTYLGYSAFASCTNLKTVKLNEGLTEIEMSAFNGCSALTDINLPNTLTALNGQVFYGCTSLVEIHIPDGVEVNDNFALCSSLKSINIPEGDNSLSRYSFEGCTSLTKIYLPLSLTEIPESVFDGTSLTDVYYAGSSSDWANVTIGAENDPLTSATIHYNYSY